MPATKSIMRVAECRVEQQFQIDRQPDRRLRTSGLFDGHCYLLHLLTYKLPFANGN